MNMGAHKVSWGKIIAGAAVAAGAVAVIAFCPETTQEVMESLKSAAGWAYDKAGDAANWLWAQIVGTGDVEAIKAAAASAQTAESVNAAVAAVDAVPGVEAGVVKDVLVETAKSATADATAKGAIAAESTKGLFHNLLGFAVQNKALAIGSAAAAGAIVAGASKAHHGHSQGHDQSFTVREQQRAAEALMVARMAAQGYQPAMAMAGQRGR
jgi:hypothetical protein